MKKKLIAFILIAAMAAALLTGCGSKGTTLDDIQKAGKLVMANSPDFPPFEFLDDNGNVTGIEADVMAAVCEKLGVDLEIVQMDFDSILLGVQAGKYDVGASGISVTPKREKNTLFTKPYCMAAQSIVVMDGSPVTCKADLDGKKIVTQTGSTAENFCMDNGYDVVSFVSNNDAQSALLTGKVEAWVIDDLSAAAMVKAYNAENENKMVILDEAMTSEPYAFGFAKGSDELVATINGIIDELVADGTIQAIFDKYDAPYTAPTK